MVYKAIDRIDTREHVKEKAFSFKVPIIFIFNKPTVGQGYIHKLFVLLVNEVLM